MTKKKSDGEKKKKGRKSLYNPEFHPKKAGELALMGKTNEEIGKILGVTIETLNQWRKQYPEFSDAIKGNKDQADAPVVRSLYQRAIGYKYTEKRVVKNPDGTVRQELTEKEVAPDVTAQIFWLKNRQPKDWRDKQIQEITGKDGAPLIPAREIPDEEVERRAREILAKRK
jgi:transposase-like protein